MVCSSRGAWFSLGAAQCPWLQLKFGGPVVFAEGTRVIRCVARQHAGAFPKVPVFRKYAQSHQRPSRVATRAPNGAPTAMLIVTEMPPAPRYGNINARRERPPRPGAGAAKAQFWTAADDMRVTPPSQCYVSPMKVMARDG
jgi:hypothetical protein